MTLQRGSTFRRRPRTVIFVILAGVGKFGSRRDCLPIGRTPRSLTASRSRCCSTRAPVVAPRSSSAAAPPRRLGSFGRSGAPARTLPFASIMEVIAQAWGSWDAAVSGATFATLKVRRARVSSARRAITRPPASLSIRSARRRPDGCPRGRRSDALRSLTRAFPPSTLPSPSLPPALAPARRWTGRCTRSAP